jgi:cell division septation protein DedD
MTILRRAPALVLALVLVVAGTVAAAPTAGAAAVGVTTGACPTADGVTVVVDFQGLGGGTVTRCVTGAGDDGFAALRGAGFSVVEPASTPNFVCRIDGAPGPASEACIDTPPHNAYWSYWRAKRGGAWVYSDIGAASKGTARAGSVQGWSFSDGSNPPPRVAPPAATSTATSAPATASPPATVPASAAPTTAGSGSTGGASSAPGTPGTGAGTPGTPGTARPGSAAPGAPGVSPSVPAATDPGVPTTVVADGATDPAGVPSTTSAPDASVLGTSETAPSTTTASSDGADGVTDERIIELASASASGSGDGGSPLGTIVAVGVVGALAGAAFVVRHRRS